MPEPTAKIFSLASTRRILPATLPDYQRRYSWSVGTSKRLLKDMIDYLCLNSQIGPSVDPFFCGGMLSHRDFGHSPIPIVDGQQRLTTLTIFATQLRDLCFENKFFEIAYEIDEELIWDERTKEYGGGKSKLEARDIAILRPNQNPRNILLYECQIDYRIPNFVEVAKPVSAGPAVTVSIKNPGGTVLFPWKLRKDLIIEFDNGSKLKITVPQSIGAKALILQGNLTKDLQGGEMAPLALGKKEAKNAKRAYARSGFAQVVKEVRNEIGNYMSSSAWSSISHLKTPRKRARQLCNLLKETRFSVTTFDTPGEALSHFVIVNGPGRQVTLSTFDLLRAQSIKIKDGDPISGRAAGGGLIPGTPDYGLNQEWETLRDNLYDINSPDEFFYPFLLSQAISPKNKERWGKGDGFMALEEDIFDSSWDPRSGWDKPKVEAYYKNINKRFLDYKDAIKIPWPTPPLARHWEEEFLLSALNSFKKMKQWIPIYMAAKENFNLKPKDRDKRIIELLTDLNYLVARGWVIPTLSAEKTAPAQTLYGNITVWIGWIRKLSTSPKNKDVKDLLKRIRKEIKSFLAKSTPYVDPANKAAPHPDLLKKDLTCTNPTARFILMHVDKSLGGGYDSKGRLIRSHSQDVEHVLHKTPQKPFKPVSDFAFSSLDAWNEARQRLGNRILLVQTFNSHYTNKSTWDFKKNGDKSSCNVKGSRCQMTKHYSKPGALRDPIVKEFWKLFGKHKKWKPSNIKTWEEWLITQFIVAVPPI